MRKVFVALILAGSSLGVAAPGTAAQPPAGAPAQPAGSREEQLAQLVEAIVPLASSRDWAAAIAAFPGARWQAPRDATDGLSGNVMRELEGSLTIAGLDYRITITGALDRLWDVTLDAPETARPPIAWTTVGRALAARQIDAELVVCADGPRGDGYRILSHQGRSAWLNFYTYEDHGGESYHFGFENPYNPASDEAGLRQMMADRCGRRR